MLDEDDEQDRLLIDDPEQSTELEKPKTPPSSDTNLTPPHSDEAAFHEINGLSQTTLSSNMEEGELEDDEAMDVSVPSSTKKSVEAKTIDLNDRKRVNGEAESPSETDVAPKKPKLKPEKRDQGTCVHSEASQADVEESVFELEAGSSFPLQLTVVCRIEGIETLYFSAKWNNRELSGILTDGDPPGFANFAKKRIALNNNSASESEKANVSTPKKRVRGIEIKKKNAKADDEDEDLDVTGMDTRDSNSSTGSIKLVEVTSSHMHPCPFDGCDHAYTSSQQVEYHISTVHKKKSVIFEHNSTQTQTDGINKSMVSVQTDTEGLDGPLLAQLKEEKKEESSFHSNDASSDDVAPILSKEEPRNPETNGVISSTPSTSKPSIPVSPRASNGLLVPAATFNSPFPTLTSSAVSTPSREKPSETKPTPSPARPAGFHPMMPTVSGPSQVHSQQQIQAAQMIQLQMQAMQMQQLMQAGGRPFTGIPTAHDLATLQALHQQAGNFPAMFPKH